MTSDRGSCRRDVNPFADESRSCGGCPDLPGASSAAGQVVAVPLNRSGGIVAVVRTQSSIHQVPPPPIVYVPCPPQPPVKCRRRISPFYGFPTPSGVCLPSPPTAARQRYYAILRVKFLVIQCTLDPKVDRFVAALSPSSASALHRCVRSLRGFSVRRIPRDFAGSV